MEIFPMMTLFTVTNVTIYCYEWKNKRKDLFPNLRIYFGKTNDIFAENDIWIWIILKEYYTKYYCYECQNEWIWLYKFMEVFIRIYGKIYDSHEEIFMAKCMTIMRKYLRKIIR